MKRGEKITCEECRAYKAGTKEHMFCAGTWPANVKHECAAGKKK